MATSLWPGMFDRALVAISLYGKKAEAHFHEATTSRTANGWYILSLSIGLFKRVALPLGLSFGIYVLVRRLVYRDPRTPLSILSQDVAGRLLDMLGGRSLSSVGRQSQAKEQYDIYQGGEEYGDPEVENSAIAEDLRLIGSKIKPTSLTKLFETMKSVGKPLDDRQMTVCLTDASTEKAH